MHFPGDLPELKARFSDVPVLTTMPDLEISPDTCTCCWFWRFTQAEQRWQGDAYLASDVFEILWEMLWELSYTEAQEIVYDFVEVSGDQEYFCLGIEKVDLNYIQAWFYYGLEGESSMSPTRLSFRCEVPVFIEKLSTALAGFAQRYRPEIDWNPFFPDNGVYFMTLQNRPWSMFPVWYALRAKLSCWQAHWLIFTTLENTFSLSFCANASKEPIDQLIAQYYWSCFLISLLENVELEYPETSGSHFSSALARYQEYVKGLFVFVKGLYGQWEGDVIYHDISDEQLNYFAGNPEYLKLTHQKYSVEMQWWIPYLKCALHKDMPVLYDGKSRRHWAEGLEKTNPEVYDRLRLKWRENMIWKACFDAAVYAPYTEPKTGKKE